jgi:hypothetical protein
MRLASLLLRARPEGLVHSPRPTSVADVVTWMGAMQAQDNASGLWSLGARLPGRTLADITDALERREALRTWPMRGTVHLVPARDARWMLDLMGAKPLAGAASRRAFLGVSDEVMDQGVEAIGEELAGGRRMARRDLLEAVRARGIPIEGQASYHLLWYASQQGVTAMAPHLGSEASFVLLDEWVPDPVRLDRDEALATMLVRWARSHGPAPRKDFEGWTGLGATDAKRAVALAGDAVTTVAVEGKDMLVDPALLDCAPAGEMPAGTLALPGFDEFVLGYKDRSLFLDPGHMDAVVPGGNGVFRATLVRGGRVIGTWTRRNTATKVVIEPALLVKSSAALRREAEASLVAYAGYLGLEPDIRWP